MISDTHGLPEKLPEEQPLQEPLAGKLSSGEEVTEIGKKRRRGQKETPNPKKKTPPLIPTTEKTIAVFQEKQPEQVTTTPLSALIEKAQDVTMKEADSLSQDVSMVEAAELIPQLSPLEKVLTSIEKCISYAKAESRSDPAHLHFLAETTTLVDQLKESSKDHQENVVPFLQNLLLKTFPLLYKTYSPETSSELSEKTPLLFFEAEELLAKLRLLFEKKGDALLQLSSDFEEACALIEIETNTILREAESAYEDDLELFSKFYPKEEVQITRLPEHIASLLVRKDGSCSIGLAKSIQEKFFPSFSKNKYSRPDFERCAILALQELWNDPIVLNKLESLEPPKLHSPGAFAIQATYHLPEDSPISREATHKPKFPSMWAL